MSSSTNHYLFSFICSMSSVTLGQTLRILSISDTSHSGRNPNEPINLNQQKFLFPCVPISCQNGLEQKNNFTYLSPFLDLSQPYFWQNHGKKTSVKNLKFFCISILIWVIGNLPNTNFGWFKFIGSFGFRPLCVCVV